MSASRTWLRIRVGFSRNPAWRAAGLSAGCPPSVVMSLMLALIEHAAVAKDAGSIKDFDYALFCRMHGADKKEVSAIVAELTDMGIIIDGRLPQGGQWDHYKTSAARTARARARKKRQRDATCGNAGVALQRPGGSPAVSSADPASDEGTAVQVSVGIGPAMVDAGKVVLGGSEPGHRLAAAVRSTGGQGAAPAVHQISDAELLELLIEAAAGNVRRVSPGGAYLPRILDLTPIRAVLAAGADLDLDILPVLRELVAVPDQPPIPKWGGFVLDEIQTRQVRRTGRAA